MPSPDAQLARPSRDRRRASGSAAADSGSALGRDHQNVTGGHDLGGLAASPAGFARQDLKSQLALADLEQSPSADGDLARQPRHPQGAALEKKLALSQFEARLPAQLAAWSKKERAALDLDSGTAPLRAEEGADRKLAGLEGLKAALARDPHVEASGGSHDHRSYVFRRRFGEGRARRSGLTHRRLGLAESGLGLGLAKSGLAHSGLRLAKSGLGLGLAESGLGLRLAHSGLGLAKNGLRLAKNGLWLAHGRLDRSRSCGSQGRPGSHRSDLDRSRARGASIGLNGNLGRRGRLRRAELDPDQSGGQHGGGGQGRGNHAAGAEASRGASSAARTTSPAAGAVGGEGKRFDRDLVGNERFEEIRPALGAGAEVSDQALGGDEREALARSGNLLGVGAEGGVDVVGEARGQSCVGAANLGQARSAGLAPFGMSLDAGQGRHSLDRGGVEEGVNLKCLETTHTP